MAFDPEFAKKVFDQTIKETRDAFDGEYAEQIKQLGALSPAEIDSITPDHQDVEEYHKLMAVVKAASANNVKNAQLADQIRQLGSVAVEIARKVPSLATIV